MAWYSTLSPSRLLEIGEAVKALPDELLATPSNSVAADCPNARPSRDRYFDIAHAILQATVDDDLPELERAVSAMNRTLANGGPSAQTDHT